MCRIVDELAGKRGMKTEDANYIFTNVSGLLVKRVPALKQIIEDVFSDEEEDERLRDHLRKLVIHLQQHSMEAFKTWQMPQEPTRLQMGNDRIL